MLAQLGQNINIWDDGEGGDADPPDEIRRVCFLREHSIEKETVCSSASDGGFQLDTFDDVIKYNTGKSLLCFLKIGGNHEVQLLAAGSC